MYDRPVLPHRTVLIPSAGTELDGMETPPFEPPGLEQMTFAASHNSRAGYRVTPTPHEEVDRSEEDPKHNQNGDDNEQGRHLLASFWSRPNVFVVIVFILSNVTIIGTQNARMRP